MMPSNEVLVPKKQFNNNLPKSDNPKALLIDNSGNTCTLLHLILKEAGIETTLYPLNSAFSLSSFTPVPDVVFVDLSIHTDEALSYTQKIKKHFGEVLIIGMTYRYEKEFIDNCKAVGIARLISVPLQSNQIYPEVKALMGLKQPG